ncbi:MAG: N-acetyl-1-D-myo-inositol-2-amino-2-deoxy-alpha-D-glucopyranoside deacetylase [Actinobacteria bacterium]|nr:N-acetyl-1-D-myo-inositol-2-amino-2-deoxy-alpha-D-glucopyranoside deacetylase [Actinomycetota bacterium]MCA1721860.1 N-acetyl-1-D-myo-inositol-2-amino-2-deoxy-alpha-D-glucopyranoside deacetylase [Actinomycetota bacterium]
MSDATLPPMPDPGERLSTDPEQAVLAEAATAVDGLAAPEAFAPLDHPRRLLLVHAHPDDETIGTGATMARYAAQNALVTLVTCTLGEEGEVLVPELEHLAADRDDALGSHRIGELAAACEALGVRDHRFLGGPGRWRDSGMMGNPSNERPECFWRADRDDAVRELVAVVREVRPQVVITYDENGGYGHPDHIQAHRVAVAAFDAAGDASYAPDLGIPWQPAKLYHSAIPKSVLQSGIDQLKASGASNFFGVDSAEDLPFGVADEVVTTEIDARDWLEHKTAAMRAHRTQIEVDGPFFALSNHIGQRAFGVEHYVLARGEKGNSAGPQGREDDLFAGVPSA